MLLSDITYALLEMIRNGSIVDDDRLDIRLIEEFVKTKRVQYVQTLVDSSRVLPEHFYQYIYVASTPTGWSPAGDAMKIYKLTDMPKIIYSRSGPTISEITPASTTNLSLAVGSLPYKLVNPHAFKYSGNGRFNTNWVFATYKDDDLILKSKNTTLASVARFSIKAVLEDPEDLSTFDVDTMDYPISKQGFDFIKEEVLRTDIKIFVSSDSDKTNDASNK